MKDMIYSSAPSNIALIKYMGKVSSATNAPANPSLSYTLENLRTHVSLHADTSLQTDQWRPMSVEDLKKQFLREEVSVAGARLAPLDLNEKAVQKFLRHLSFLKSEFQITQNFHVCSGNNFPSDAGLASSASSFAALTKAFFDWLQMTAPALLEEKRQRMSSDLTLNDLMSDMSRRGSGSSCRSFFSPWSIWDENGAHGFHCAHDDLSHLALVISAEKKSVSSSQAHELVLGSPKFQGRVQRAQGRMEKLKEYLGLSEQAAWNAAFHLCWDEFWDMHELFHTCPQPFRYMNSMTEKALVNIQKLWTSHADGPLVTMDAGPNIHFLFRPDQMPLKKIYVQNLSQYGLLIESAPKSMTERSHD